MDFTIKNLDVKQKTAKITLDRLNVNNADNDLRALAILLGGYNQYGRNINLDEHRKNMQVFRELIDVISSKI